MNEETLNKNQGEPTADQYDAMIESLHLVEATGLTHDELRTIVRRALVSLNLSYVLADVVDWLMKDVEDELLKVKVPYDDRDRSYFKEMKKLVGASRKWAQRATRDLYHIKEADEFAGESDWWYNIIRLIEDRTGEDELKTKQVLQWLTTMPSVLGLFKVKMKDFLRLTDEYDTIPRKD